MGKQSNEAIRAAADRVRARKAGAMVVVIMMKKKKKKKSSLAAAVDGTPVRTL